MNLVEELQSLDVNDVGRWPLPFPRRGDRHCLRRWSSASVYFFIVKDKHPQLRAREAGREDLRLAFENKQRKAANYDAYKAQLAQIEQSFGTMLRQLPGETEIPSLIVDISQTGLAAGLQEKLFQPQPEIPRDFYAEKPIKIRAVGRLSRDRQLRQRRRGAAAYRHAARHQHHAREQRRAFDQLSMEVTAKTYRYLEELSNNGALASSNTSPSPRAAVMPRSPRLRRRHG